VTFFDILHTYFPTSFLPSFLHPYVLTYILKLTFCPKLSNTGTPDACQKVHQRTTLCKCLLNYLPAPHQSLIGGESQEDYEAAGCMVFSGHTQLTVLGAFVQNAQRLMIVKDGE